MNDERWLLHGIDLQTDGSCYECDLEARVVRLLAALKLHSKIEDEYEKGAPLESVIEWQEMFKEQALAAIKEAEEGL